MITEASNDTLIMQPTIMGWVEIVVIFLWFNCAITGLPAGEGKVYEMPLRIKVICVGSTKVEAAIGINSSYC